MSSDENNDDDKKDRLNDKAVDQAKHDALFGTGYKSPPRHSQFKKGTSGNPKGRPRAPKADGLSVAEQPLLNAILARANKTVRLREGDIVREVGTREALVDSIAAAALKGNARSQGLLHDMFHRADVHSALERRKRREFGQTLKEVQTREFQAAQKDGKDTRLILPHPDDIELDDAVGYRIKGPIDEADLKEVEELIAIRDVLILQYELDTRTAPVADVTLEPSQVVWQESAALFLAYMLNSRLPKRFQWDDAKLLGMMMRYDHWSKRRLLRETYQAWQALGKDVPRGTRMPSVDYVARRIRFGIDVWKAVEGDIVDLQSMARGEVSEELLELGERHGIDLIGWRE